MDELTPQQAAFVREYLIDLNATKAAKRAGYSAKTAAQQASRLLANVKVEAAIDQAKAARAARTEITADLVLEELWGIVTADPNELVEFRRNCCRYCWGEDHEFQETERERASRHRAWKAETLKDSEDDEAPVLPFNELGGTGFDHTREPNPECPECQGEGSGEVFLKDTRELSPAARRLYAGVKVTKDGVEVKMHDKLAALAKVGQHLGMFAEKVDHNVDGALTINIKRFAPDDGGD